jgi:hypothetical protein
LAIVQPLVSRVSNAVTAAGDHVEYPAFVPPFSVRVMLVAVLATKLSRIFSMDWAVKAQLYHALVKAVAAKVPVVSNILAGKVARPLHAYHA